MRCAEYDLSATERKRANSSSSARCAASAAPTLEGAFDICAATPSIWRRCAVRISLDDRALWLYCSAAADAAWVAFAARSMPAAASSPALRAVSPNLDVADVAAWMPFTQTEPSSINFAPN
jgi:hypothetical protein